MKMQQHMVGVTPCVHDLERYTHTHTFVSPSRAAAAVTARLVPALVRPLRPLAPKPGFSKPLLKPLPVYKQGQTERQAWLAGMYSCFAFPSLTCFSKLAEQKMLTFCSSWSWPHWGLWPPSGSAPASPPLLPLQRLLLPRAAEGQAPLLQAGLQLGLDLFQGSKVAQCSAAEQVLVPWKR